MNNNQDLLRRQISDLHTYSEALQFLFRDFNAIESKRFSSAYFEALLKPIVLQAEELLQMVEEDEQNVGGRGK